MITHFSNISTFRDRFRWMSMTPCGACKSACPTPAVAHTSFSSVLLCLSLNSVGSPNRRHPVAFVYLIDWFVSHCRTQLYICYVMMRYVHMFHTSQITVRLRIEIYESRSTGIIMCLTWDLTFSWFVGCKWMLLSLVELTKVVLLRFAVLNL